MMSSLEMDDILKHENQSMFTPQRKIKRDTYRNLRMKLSFIEKNIAVPDPQSLFSRTLTASRKGPDSKPTSQMRASRPQSKISRVEAIPVNLSYDQSVRFSANAFQPKRLLSNYSTLTKERERLPHSRNHSRETSLKNFF